MSNKPLQTTQRRTRVVIFDDYETIFLGLRMELEELGDIKVVATTTEPGAVVELASKCSADVVIMDLNYHNLTVEPSFDALARLHEELPEAKVVVYTAYPKPEYYQRAQDLHVWGFTRKAPPPGYTTLADVIRRVMKGEPYWDPFVVAETYRRSGVALAALALPVADEGEQADHTTSSELEPRLSEREWEVICLYIEGHKRDTVAKQLFVCKSTIDSHLTTIFRKLNVNTKLAARERVLALIATGYRPVPGATAP